VRQQSLPALWVPTFIVGKTAKSDAAFGERFEQFKRCFVPCAIADVDAVL
jgi:hypothetical protein